MRNVADLRAAGMGVHKVLLVHDATSVSSDLFFWVLTMLDPKVVLDVVAVPPPEESAAPIDGVLQRDQERARSLGREIHVESLGGTITGRTSCDCARDGHYELIILPLPQERPIEKGRLCDPEMSYVPVPRPLPGVPRGTPGDPGRGWRIVPNRVSTNDRRRRRVARAPRIAEAPEVDTGYRFFPRERESNAEPNEALREQLSTRRTRAESPQLLLCQRRTVLAARFSARSANEVVVAESR